MSDQFFLIGLVVVAYLLAGSVKGVIGMGLPTVAIAIVPALAGMVIGQKVRALVSVATFRLCLFVLLLVLGLQLVARNLVW